MTPQEIDFDKTKHDDDALYHFEAMCCLAHSVMQNIGLLVGATEEADNDWRDILDDFSTQLIDRLPTIGKEPNVQHYVDWIRKELRALAATFSRENPALSSALNLIASQTSPFPRHGMKVFFEGKAKKAYELAIRCLMEWGGPKCQAHISDPRFYPAKLIFVASSGRRAFDMYYDPDKKTIFIPVGMNKGMLRSCLNLEFYLFHEYLSHAFPVYEDDLDVFAESYLMAVERKYFAFAAETFVQVSLSKSDFEEHQSRMKRETDSSSYYQGLEERMAWILELCDDRRRIPGLLLDLAVTSPKTVEEDFHELFLARLLSASRETIMRIVCGSSAPTDELLSKLPSNLPTINRLKKTT